MGYVGLNYIGKNTVNSGSWVLATPVCLTSSQAWEKLTGVVGAWKAVVPKEAAKPLLEGKISDPDKLFKPDALVWAHATPRGGYGFTVRIPGVIKSVTKKTAVVEFYPVDPRTGRRCLEKPIQKRFARANVGLRSREDNIRDPG